MRKAGFVLVLAAAVSLGAAGLAHRPAAAETVTLKVRGMV